jgi:hypothetical protein
MAVVQEGALKQPYCKFECPHVSYIILCVLLGARPGSSDEYPMGISRSYYMDTTWRKQMIYNVTELKITLA